MFKRNQQTRAYSNYNRFCGQHFKDRFEKFQQHFFEDGGRAHDAAAVPVNIAENAEFYEVQVFAAGRKKEQFQVSINYFDHIGAICPVYGYPCRDRFILFFLEIREETISKEVAKN